MAEFILDATTNLEGGEKCRYEVRGYRELLFDRHVLNCFANHFLLRFLETLDFLGMSIARMPPESPCRRLSDCLGQEAERHGIFGKDEVDEVVDQEWNDVE
jgi:hypothetical protein